MAVGRVGRPHGRDGSFYVEGASHSLAQGTPLSVAGVERRVERRGGTDERPLVRLGGVTSRNEAAELRGEPLLAAEAESPLEEGEWRAADLIGCTVPGIGKVRRIVAAPSCDILEVGDEEVLVPFVSDAVRRIDPEARLIEVDLCFLGLADAGRTT